jgi:uncharacterized protein
MPLTRVLIDTSFLYAIYDRKDKHHLRTREMINAAEIELILPDVVLVEALYLLKSRIGMQAVVRCLDGLLASRIPLEPITSDDLLRIREITTNYSDAKLDFVDCCIMALSERLTITKVLTFDHRDFGIFRPQHCDFLELLP